MTKVSFCEMVCYSTQVPLLSNLISLKHESELTKKSFVVYKLPNSFDLSDLVW